jgi:hypothetical protein
MIRSIAGWGFSAFVSRVKAPLYVGILGGVVAMGCGEREAKWDAPLPENGQAKWVGLSDAVAISDDGLERIVFVAAKDSESISTSDVQVGKNLRRLIKDPTGDRIYALSAGEIPREDPEDQKPSLSVIDGGAEAELFQRYELDGVYTDLTLDPEGQWVVLMGSDEGENTVTNPNELILIDVTDKERDPVKKTIRSFGGRPQRLTFTSTLDFPDGTSGRLLLVETERDLAVIDLGHLEEDETTVGFPETENGSIPRSTSVTFDNGLPDDSTDTRLAIAFQGSSDVVLIEMIAEAGHRFTLLPRLANVGGVPASIAFVATDQGTRLAALLGTKPQAVLVDPATTIAEPIDLPAAFTQFLRVTDPASDAKDEALLWGLQAKGIAFWSLGETGEQAFRSVEGLDLQAGVQSVIDVPGKPRQKLLKSGTGTQFYILDLDSRQAFPMLTRTSDINLVLSPDGQRAWALPGHSTKFARIDLSDLHPTSLQVDRPVDALFDIEANDGNHVALALHASGAFAATTLNADDPDSTETRFHTGLLVEGF